MRVALCTTCRDRTHHLRETLPKNLADWHAHKDSVFVVLDYGDPGALAEYIMAKHGADIDAGRLVYYRTDEPSRFEMAKAKNMAHRCGMREGAEVLVNVDADNFWPFPGFIKHVSRKFEEASVDSEPIFLGPRANHHGPGELIAALTPRGCFGRIAVSVEAFRLAGGYDEIFDHYSADDKDFAARLTNLGYVWRRIRPDYLAAIKHYAAWQSMPVCDEIGVLEGRSRLTVVNAGSIGCGIVRRNFAAEPIEIKPIPARVFGIGLHKTGTTSLAQAFRMLGYDAVHWPSPQWAQAVWNEMRAMGRSPRLERHYAACDLPIPLLYQELDAAYPGSRFILTVRDEDEWLRSVRLHWAALERGWDNDPFSHDIHRELYGTAGFDEPAFRARYRRHNAEVERYFRGRPESLLTLPMNEGTSMNTLCQFLDAPLMHRRMPHRHRSSEQAKYQAALGR